MDRLDYVSMMCNEHVYVRAIEQLMGVKVPIRAEYIRVMFDEITRLLNHLMWLAAAGLDLGAMSMFLYCFREREDLMICMKPFQGLDYMQRITDQAAWPKIYPLPCRNFKHPPGKHKRQWMN